MNDFDKAIELMKEFSFAEAEAIFAAHLKSNPGDWHAKLLRGVCALMLGDVRTFLRIHKQADRKFAKAKPSNEKTCLMLAKYAILAAAVTAGAFSSGCGKKHSHHDDEENFLPYVRQGNTKNYNMNKSGSAGSGQIGEIGIIELKYGAPIMKYAVYPYPIESKYSVDPYPIKAKYSVDIDYPIMKYAVTEI